MGADVAAVEDVDPGVVLAAVLGALDADGRVLVAVLRPVRGAGRIVDFDVLSMSASATASGMAMAVVTRRDAEGHRLSEVAHTARFPDQLALNREAFEVGHPVRRDENYLDADGAARTLEITRTRTGDLVVSTWQDVTELRAAEMARTASEQRFRALVEHSSDITIVVDREGVISYASPSTQRFVPATATATAEATTLEGLPYGLPTHPEDKTRGATLLERAYEAAPGEVVRERVRAITGDGQTRWIEAQATNHLHTPGVAGVVINCRDVTEEQHARERLAQEAMHDPLTGLPNRRYFTEALQHALARSARSGKPVALLLLDVDHFKDVNDAHGHPAGDRLLVDLAQRLQAALRPGDTFCRLGGDEFVVLAEDLHQLDEALLVAERVTAAAAGAYPLGSGEVRVEVQVSVSIGISTMIGPGDPVTLLSTADHALYEAKRRGRNRAEVFQPHLRDHLLHRLSLQRDLRHATDREELELYWQPIVRASDHAITGAEALLRWHHPQLGLLAPAAFIPAAEEAGLMPRICEWVLHHAAAQRAAWVRELAQAPQVFVNLDRHQLHNADLPTQLAEIATAHRADLTGLTLEVSERILTEDLSRIRPLLHRLRESGLSLALDDFGAGNTALTWLQQMPMDVLKLDRCFTATLGDPASEAIVAAVLRLAPQLGIATLAEGVETAQQLSTLIDLGCSYTQGFHHARPQPAGYLTAALFTT